MNLRPALVPSGYAPFWMATAVTPNETLLRAGTGAGPGGAGSEYLDLAFADRYSFIAFAESPPNLVGGIFASAAGTPAITLPTAINPSLSGSPVSVTNLAASANLLVYTINADWGTPVVVNATISKTYLGNATEYTLPDLTALSGFGDTLPQSGDTVNVTVSAVESSLTLEEMANQDDADLFLLPDGTNVTFAEKYLNYVLP